MVATGDQLQTVHRQAALLPEQTVLLQVDLQHLRVRRLVADLLHHPEPQRWNQDEPVVAEAVAMVAVAVTVEVAAEAVEAVEAVSAVVEAEAAEVVAEDDN
jgi:hypothetical protein